MAYVSRDLKLRTIDNPKSKWPYWIIIDEDHGNLQFIGRYHHYLIKMQLAEDKIDVVCQIRWGKQEGISGRSNRRQIGRLYKFKNDEDRLVFLMKAQQ
jgi:hypothetical protein